MNGSAAIRRLAEAQDRLHQFFAPFGGLDRLVPPGRLEPPMPLGVGWEGNGGSGVDMAWRNLWADLERGDHAMASMPRHDLDCWMGLGAQTVEVLNEIKTWQLAPGIQEKLDGLQRRFATRFL